MDYNDYIEEQSNRLGINRKMLIIIEDTILRQISDDLEIDINLTHLGRDIMFPFVADFDQIDIKIKEDKIEYMRERILEDDEYLFETMNTFQEEERNTMSNSELGEHFFNWSNNFEKLATLNTIKIGRRTVIEEIEFVLDELNYYCYQQIRNEIIRDRGFQVAWGIAS